MPESIFNYASFYQPELIELIKQESLISPLLANPTNIKFTGAKTFHLTAMNASGFKEHSREGGWNRQPIRQTDQTFTITHDRDVEFFVDKANVDETNMTASIGNITRIFMKQQATPEMDAYTFSTLATRAIDGGDTKYLSTEPIAKDTVYEQFKKLLLPLRRYSRTLIGYATSEWMDALEQSPRFNRNIDVANIAGPKSIETRVASVDGIRIIEVYDEERFKTEFDYTDGFKSTVTAKQIKFMLVSNEYNFFAPKFESIYNYAPGQHTLGDGYLYQNRSMWDVFTIKNHNDVDNPIIDSISIQYEA